MTAQIHIRNKFMALLEGLDGFSGPVMAGKLDVYERPMASVYLTKLESRRATGALFDREQLVAVVLADEVEDAARAEEHLADLGLAIEAAAVEADFGEAEVTLDAQEISLSPDAPDMGVLSQVYQAAWTQTLNT